MIPLGPVVARSRVRAARADVWTSLVDDERRSTWWPELRLDPRLGGEIAEQWSEGDGDSAVSRDASGEVDVWVDGHAIGYRWSEAGDDRQTAVLITLRSQGTETGITVTETGFDALPSPAQRAAASQEGWQVLLRDLVTAVDVAVAAGDFAEPELETEAEAGAEEAKATDLQSDEANSGSGPGDAEGTDAEIVDAEVVDADIVDAEVVDAEVVDADVVDADLVDADVVDADAEGADDDGANDDDADFTDEAESDSDEDKLEAEDDDDVDDDETEDGETEEEDEEVEENEASEPDFDTLIRGS